VKAQDKIHRGLRPIRDASELEWVHQTYMTAFGDEKLASKAVAAFAEQLVEIKTGR
jgi:hypothetical protein